MKFEFCNEMKLKHYFCKNLYNVYTSQASGSPNPITANHHSVNFCMHNEFAHRRINENTLQCFILFPVQQKRTNFAFRGACTSTISEMKEHDIIESLAWDPRIQDLLPGTATEICINLVKSCNNSVLHFPTC